MGLRISSRDRIEILEEILAFYAAQRNYGYIDRLGNALDEITAYEALKDVIRDFNSICIDSDTKYVEIEASRTETVVIDCPDISPEDLKEAVEDFIKSIEEQGGDVIVKETRKLSLRALAKKHDVLKRARRIKVASSKGGEI